MITTLPFYTILITLLYYLYTFYHLYFLIFLFPSSSVIFFQKVIHIFYQLINLSTKLSTYQHIIVFSIFPYIFSFPHYFSQFHFLHKFLHISSWQRSSFMLYSSQSVKKPNKTLTFSSQNPQCFIDN